VWRCPVCHSALTQRDRAWRCASGHAFDEAREGYVNLLITHQRRQRQPGDSPEMLRHRRAFLEAGHYSPLAVAIEERLPTGHLLDAGCGEGWYSRRWPQSHPGSSVWAVDIAKDGVRLAARRAPIGGACHYAVASVYDLPLLDNSMDAVVNIFSPVHSPEIGRVLQAGGLLITATPGPEHLLELKRHLFTEPERHDGAGPLDQLATTDPAMRKVDSHRLHYGITLSRQEEVKSLLGMVPYAWYVDEATRNRVENLPCLETAVDFVLSIYRW